MKGTRGNAQNDDNSVGESMIVFLFFKKGGREDKRSQIVTVSSVGPLGRVQKRSEIPCFTVC